MNTLDVDQSHAFIHRNPSWVRLAIDVWPMSLHGHGNHLNLYGSSIVHALTEAGQVAHRVSVARNVAVPMNKAGLLSFCHLEYTLETHIYDVRVGCFLLLYRRSGNKPYTWDVMSGHTSLGVCLERMHRAFSELLVLAQRYNPVETGPRKVSIVVDQLSRAGPLFADVYRTGLLCCLNAAVSVMP